MATISEARSIRDRPAAFPTISHDTNLPLVDRVEDYLKHHCNGALARAAVPPGSTAGVKRPTQIARPVDEERGSVASAPMVAGLAA